MHSAKVPKIQLKVVDKVNIVNYNEFTRLKVGNFKHHLSHLYDNTVVPIFQLKKRKELKKVDKKMDWRFGWFDAPA